MQEVGLNPEFVRRMAEIHEGNATAHLKAVSETMLKNKTEMPWTQHEMLGASGLVISASLWSLVDATQAMRIYRRASTLYRRLNHSYWITLAVVSGNKEQLTKTQSRFTGAMVLTPQIVAFGLVSSELFNRRYDFVDTRSLHSQWKHIGNVPVGRLGIPLDHYGECADAMRSARQEKQGGRFMKAAGNYVRRASEVIRSASHDRFHWRRLQSSILPAEPEAVAMTTAMSIVAHDFLHTSISEIPNLDSHSRLLVETGERMRKAIQSEQ